MAEKEGLIGANKQVVDLNPSQEDLIPYYEQMGLDVHLRERFNLREKVTRLLENPRLVLEYSHARASGS